MLTESVAPLHFGGDCCLGFFEEAWHDGVLPIPDGGAVLEIGSAEFDWITPFREIRRDLTVTGIDWRRSEAGIQADVLTYDFPNASFDGIVSISTFEHIGLGAYENDPIDDDGDTHAIQRAWSWLKPGGWLYFDVPYRPDGAYAIRDGFRAYNPTAFRARLGVKGAREIWRKLFDIHLADAPYLAVVWEKSA